MLGLLRYPKTYANPRDWTYSQEPSKKEGTSRWPCQLEGM